MSHKDYLIHFGVEVFDPAFQFHPTFVTNLGRFDNRNPNHGTGRCHWEYLPKGSSDREPVVQIIGSASGIPRVGSSQQTLDLFPTIT